MASLREMGYSAADRLLALCDLKVRRRSGTTSWSLPMGVSSRRTPTQQECLRLEAESARLREKSARLGEKNARLRQKNAALLRQRPSIVTSSACRRPSAPS